MEGDRRRRSGVSSRSARAEQSRVAASEQLEREEREELEREERSGHRNPPCPKCGSTRTHRAKRRSALDKMMRLVHKRPIRCSGCKFRFFDVGGKTVSAGAIEQIGRRMFMLIGVVVGAVFCAYVVRYLTRGLAKPGPSE